MTIPYRRQQELESSHSADNPVLMSELRALRLRKDELETHLITLQDSRRQLMIQLEGLMKMLKVRDAEVPQVFDLLMLFTLQEPSIFSKKHPEFLSKEH